MDERFTIRSVITYMKDRLKRAGIRDYEEDAFLLLNCVREFSKSDILLNGDKTLDEQERVKLFYLLHDRLRRVPMQHITEKAYFYGMEFKVNGNVLIPRPDTEILVEEVLKNLMGDERVLDMCTGSGCILIACDKADSASGFNIRSGTGVDISVKALEVAKENAKKHGADNLEFIQGDLFENVRGEYDLIVSNPPYIPGRDIPDLDPEVRDFDPLCALDGGEDGLSFYRRIAEGAPDHLKKDGTIYLEIGYNQAEDVSKILEEKGFSDTEIIKDYGGNNRVVKAVSRTGTGR